MTTDARIAEALKIWRERAQDTLSKGSGDTWYFGVMTLAQYLLSACDCITELVEEIERMEDSLTMEGGVALSRARTAEIERNNIRLLARRVIRRYDIAMREVLEDKEAIEELRAAVGTPQ